MSKRKIIAIVLFCFAGLFLSTYITPGIKMSPVKLMSIEEDIMNISELEKNRNEDKLEKKNNNANITNKKKPIISPINLTVNPERIIILKGDSYNLMTGLKFNQEANIILSPNIIDTSTLDVGKQSIIYTATDSNGRKVSVTRTVIVLLPESDEDGDGFTNEEEIKIKSDPLNQENTPEYSKELNIDISKCNTNMVVYDNITDFNSCILVTDKFYGNEGIEFAVDTSKVDKSNIGTYKVKVTAYDNLNNKTEKTFDYEVIPRKIYITIDNKQSEYLDTIKQFTSNEAEVKGDGADIGVKLSSDVTQQSTTGEYEITGTWDNKNYDVTFEKGVYTIAPKQIGNLSKEEFKNLFDIEYNDMNENYNGTEHENLIIGNIPSELHVIYKNNKEINAGVYNSEATITGTNNYAGTATLNATLTINKAPVTIKLEDKNITYGDTPKELTYQILEGQIYGKDNLNISITKDEPSNSNAGSYEIIGTWNNQNYHVKFINGMYIIKKAIPTYVVPNGLTGEEDTTLSQIKLPTGFIYQDNTTSSLPPGIYKVKLTYTPKDTVNYEIVTDIDAEVIINETYYTITFVDKNSNVISVQKVRKHMSATEPEIEEEYEEGNKNYVFSGWIGNYIEVMADATITPLYIKESTSSTYAYVLKPEYYMPENGAGYDSSCYTNALETEAGEKISLSIKIGGLTEEQANSILNQRTTVVALGEECVMKYLTKSTKEQLASITKSTDAIGAYTIEWYVLKYQPDGWHLDGYKVYDTITLNIKYHSSTGSIKRPYISLNFNNAVKDVTVNIDEAQQSIINSSSSNDIGNQYIIYHKTNTVEETIKINYNFKNIEYTKEYILKNGLITETIQNKSKMLLPINFLDSKN